MSISLVFSTCLVFLVFLFFDIFGIFVLVLVFVLVFVLAVAVLKIIACNFFQQCLSKNANNKFYTKFLTQCASAGNHT